MMISGCTTVTFPLITGSPSGVVLILTRAPDAVLYDAPETRRGEYAAKPWMTCASTKLLICSGLIVALLLRLLRKAASLGANTVTLGEEPLVEFELAKYDENLEVDSVAVRVSARDEGGVKKLMLSIKNRASHM
jgi:hypothetical protein